MYLLRSRRTGGIYLFIYYYKHYENVAAQQKLTGGAPAGRVIAITLKHWWS